MPCTDYYSSKMTYREAAAIYAPVVKNILNKSTRKTPREDLKEALNRSQELFRSFLAFARDPEMCMDLLALTNKNCV